MDLILYMGQAFGRKKRIGEQKVKKKNISK
jgi:hypothetical protein